MNKPVILCGLGRVGWRVLEYLRAGGLPVVIIDSRCDAADPRLAGVRCIQGDCRRQEVLKEAGVAESRGVLVMTSDDLVNITTALMVRHLHPEVRVVMRAFNQNLLLRLGKAVHNVFALSTSTLTAPLLAMTALAGQALGTFRLEGIAEGKRQVAEVAIGSNAPLVGKTIGDIAGGADAIVLAHQRKPQADRFLLEVDAAAQVATGDRLTVCGNPRQLAPLLAQRVEDQDPVLLWAGWLRRMGRVAWRTLSEIDLPVKICTGVLLGVMIVSTLVFRLGVDKYSSTADAFYRTISLIATGADMGERDLEYGWQKIFVSLLRIVGAALIAAFTAIVTNYLLRARLSGALEVRRIPDSGHVVVCGLGALGFRTVQELVRSGERVVVIELQADNRFVATARRLGAAVIHGDATIREVLRQAKAASARSVVAATSNELVNLEIALLVRELNPTQRVVVCLSDPNLAQTLREAANIRLAVSVPSLAAPAFVAALFGDRVQNVFLVAGRLLAVVDLLVHPDDALLIGQAVHAVAFDYRLLPLALISANGTLQSRPKDTLLAAGDRLIGFVTLPDLERLLRREPVFPRSTASTETG